MARVLYTNIIFVICTDIYCCVFISYYLYARGPRPVVLSDHININPLYTIDARPNRRNDVVGLVGDGTRSRSAIGPRAI